MSIHSIKGFLDESKFNRFHLSLLLWCILIVTLEGYNLAVFGSVIPLMMKEWGLSTTQVGVIGSYGLFGMMSGAIFLSSLADKLGQKRLLIASTVLFSLSITISALAPNAQVFAWCRLLGGIGFGGALPTIISLLAEYAPKTSKNKAITIALSGYQVGGILAPLMGIVFISSFGWRSVIWFAAIPLLLLPFIIKNIPESPQYLIKKGKWDVLDSTLAKIDVNYKQKLAKDSVAIIAVGTEKVSILRLFNNRLGLSTILFCIMFFMGLLVINFLITWLPNLMLYAGYPLSSSLYVTIFLNVGTILGTICWGIFSDNNGLSKRLLVYLYILGACFLALMGIKSNIILLYFLVAATGFFLFSAHSLLSAFVSQYYPDDVRSTAVGFGTGIGQFGGVLAPTLGGIFISMNLSITTCFIMFALPGIFAAISLLLVKRKSSKPVPHLENLKEKNSIRLA